MDDDTLIAVSLFMDYDFQVVEFHYYSDVWQPRMPKWQWRRSFN